jgi:hypothetical protein
MPEEHTHTYDLILRLSADYAGSIRARRMLSYILMGVGLVIIVGGLLIESPELGGTFKLITSAAGLSIGGSSLFPFNDIIKMNLKIRTLENLRADLEHKESVSDADAQKIEAIIWKVVEQTVTT